VVRSGATWGGAAGEWIDCHLVLTDPIMRGGLSGASSTPNPIARFIEQVLCHGCSLQIVLRRSTCPRTKSSVIGSRDYRHVLRIVGRGTSRPIVPFLFSPGPRRTPRPVAVLVDPFRTSSNVPGCRFGPNHRRFFLASRTPIPAISSSRMNRIPALSNAAWIRITVET
jgi:hypothetical protein